MAMYLLDTSALVDWLNGVPSAAELLSRLAQGRHTLAVCSISVAETYSGLTEDDWPAADRVFAAFEYWDVDAETAKRAGRYRYVYARRGQPLPVTDTLMASLAIANDATLVTGNIKDFPMPELRLEKLPPA